MSIIYPVFHLAIAIVELVLIVLAFQHCRKYISVATIVLPIVLASMSYDNIVLGIGHILGAGEPLKTLSLLRFFLHYTVLPLLIVVGVELAGRAGAKWATTVTRGAAWVVALVLAGIDLANKFINIELQPMMFLGVLRYTSIKSGSVPIITIVILVFTLLIGVGLWVRLKWPWLFWGSVIAFIGNAIPISIVGTLVGSAAELMIGICFVLAQQQVAMFRQSSAPYLAPASSRA